nr:protein kibra-like [Procambarus clarkii]
MATTTEDKHLADEGLHKPEEDLHFKEYISEFLKIRCSNTLDLRGELRLSAKFGNTTGSKEQDPDEDAMAVVYIVFVLLFFATSLLVVLVKYIRREKESVRLEKFYEEYMNRRHDSLIVYFDESGRLLQSVPGRKPSGAKPRPSTPDATPTTTPTTTPVATPTVTPVATPTVKTAPVFPVSKTYTKPTPV